MALRNQGRIAWTRTIRISGPTRGMARSIFAAENKKEKKSTNGKAAPVMSITIQHHQASSRPPG